MGPVNKSARVPVVIVQHASPGSPVTPIGSVSRSGATEDERDVYQRYLSLTKPWSVSRALVGGEAPLGQPVVRPRVPYEVMNRSSVEMAGLAFGKLTATKPTVARAKTEEKTFGRFYPPVMLA